MTQRDRFVLGLVVAGAVLAADQASKQIVLHNAALAQRFSLAVLPGLLHNMPHRQPTSLSQRGAPMG